MYFALGDGGAAGDPLSAGQNPDLLLGSILRIDVDHPDLGEFLGAVRQVAGGGTVLDPEVVLWHAAAVAVGNGFAPVLGKISMNTVVVDVTELDGVQVGDEATVFGGIIDTRASLTTTEQQFRTIMADLYSDWGLRSQRIYR